MGGVFLLGDLAMTTYNRQPARQRGVEVHGCHAVTGGGGGTGTSVYDPGDLSFTFGLGTPRLETNFIGYPKPVKRIYRLPQTCETNLLVFTRFMSSLYRVTPDLCKEYFFFSIFYLAGSQVWVTM